MGTVTASGIGSGLDIDGLVKKIVEAERAPRQAALDLRETRLQTRLTSYGTFRSAAEQLRSALAVLADLSKFQARSVEIGDETLFAATAGSTSVPGSYAVEVVDLAAAHKLRTAAGAFATAESVVGTGTLNIAVGGASMSLAITDANNTLAGIRDAINCGTGNPGVKATIVTGTNGVQLVLTSEETGATNTIRVTQSGGNGGLVSLVYDPGVTTALTEVQAANNAKIIVDGIEATSTTNTFANVITGVEITAVAESTPGSQTALTVGYDRSASKKSVEDVVKAYNSLLTSLRALGKYDVATKTGGPLVGDSTLRDFLTALRREISLPLDGQDGFGTLTDLGIGFSIDGSLTVDSTRLTGALNANFDDVGAAFARSGSGVAVRLDRLLDTYVDSGGLIEARTKGLQNSIKDIGESRDALAERLTKVEARLRRQYGAMDILVAQLRNTGNYLASQLASLTTSS